MSKPFTKTEEVLRERDGSIRRRRMLYKVRCYWPDAMVSVSQDVDWRTFDAWLRATVDYSLGARECDTSEVTAVRSLAAALADAADVAAKWNREKYKREQCNG